MEADVGIDFSQSYDKSSLMDEGYHSMINCAVNTQLETVQEELKLMKEGKRN